MKTTKNNATGSNSLFKKVGNAFNNLNSYFSSFQNKITGTPNEPVEDDEFSTMICPLTGALSRVGLSNYFDQIVPSELTKMSLIFIELDYFDDHVRQFSTTASDKNLQKIVNKIIDSCCGDRDLLARWSLKELVLVCPEMQVTSAVKLANKISLTINRLTWDKGTEITCTAGAAQANGEDLHDLISQAKTEILKAKKAA